MKKLYQYMMILLAGVLGACSSLSVDDPYADGLPAGFNVKEYMELHPYLRMFQIKDYVADYNAAFKDSVTAAGGDYSALKATDEALFTADVASLMAICADSTLGDYSADTCASVTSFSTVVSALTSFNFVGRADDLQALASIPVDEVAISQQYTVFGKSHGWPYRYCTAAEAANPERNPEIIKAQQNKAESVDKFVVDNGTYCRDANGVVRQILQ